MEEREDGQNVGERRKRPSKEGLLECDAEVWVCTGEVRNKQAERINPLRADRI